MKLILIALLFIASTAQAQRSAEERIAIMGAALVPAVVTGSLWGYADATQNMWRKQHLQDGYESPEAARLNQDWHLYGAMARGMIVVDMGAALGIGTVARPDWKETLALSGASAVGVLMSHHLAHNVREGKGLFYFGTVAPTDRLARDIGEVPTLLAVSAVNAGILYLTYRILD